MYNRINTIMKKILVFAALLVILIFGCRQAHWMISRGGNLNIHASNSSDEKMVTMEVFVNGESVYIQDHSNKKILDYKGLALYKTTGIYEIKVVAAKYDLSRTTRINLETVKWLNIEFVNDENDPEKYDLQLSLESSPVVVEVIFPLLVFYY